MQDVRARLNSLPLMYFHSQTPKTGLGLGVKCIDLETGQETQQDPSRSQHEQQAASQ